MSHYYRFVGRRSSPAYRTLSGKRRVIDLYIFDSQAGYRMVWQRSAFEDDPRQLAAARREWRRLWFDLNERAA